jgi:YVTN family beta-propeller protein
VTQSLTRRTLFLASALPMLAACSALTPPSVSAPAAPAAQPLATIPVGDGPTLLAMAPDGSRVYAASGSGLSVIATATNTLVASVRTPPEPTGLVVSPDGQRVYVANLFSTRLAAVDTAALAIASSIELFVGQLVGGFGRIAVAPPASVAYVCNADNAALAIVDLADPDPYSLMMDMRPYDIALSPDGRTAYVAGCDSFCVTGSVEVLDTASRRVTGTMQVGPRPYRIAVTADGRRAYTTNLGDPSVSVVDLATQSAIATVRVPLEPTGLAVSRDGSSIYVTSQTSGNVVAIDATTNNVRGVLHVGSVAREVVVTPDGRRLYVSTERDVVVLDARSFG